MAQGKPRNSAPDHINCTNCNTEIKTDRRYGAVVCECGEVMQLAMRVQARVIGGFSEVEATGPIT